MVFLITNPTICVTLMYSSLFAMLISTNLIIQGGQWHQKSIYWIVRLLNALTLHVLCIMFLTQKWWEKHLDTSMGTLVNTQLVLDFVLQVLLI